MVRKAIKQVLLTLCVLVVAYPLSIYPVVWLFYHHVIPAGEIDGIIETYYAPLKWYVRSGLPGSIAYNSSIDWFGQLGTPVPDRE